MTQEELIKELVEALEMAIVVIFNHHEFGFIERAAAHPTWEDCDAKGEKEFWEKSRSVLKKVKELK